MTYPQQGTTFASQLKAERETIQSFLDLLLREQDVLIRGEDERIDAQVEEKSRLLARLARFAENRGRLLGENRHNPDRRGMETWLAQRSEAASLLEEWQEVTRLTEAAYRVNQTNGVLIDIRMRANQQAHVALASAARVNQLYGPDGRAHCALGSREIGAV